MRRAAFRLGLLYQDGRGIGQNHKLAVHWYRDAAEAGLPEAQMLIWGYLYERGLGLKADGVQAAVWYRRAAIKVRCKHIEASACCMRSVVWFRVTMLLLILALSCKGQRRRGIGSDNSTDPRIRGGPDAERKAAVLRDDWNAQR